MREKDGAPGARNGPSWVCRYTGSGGGLLLIGRDEGIGYERFVTGWGGVLRCARVKGTHVSGVERAGHLQQKPGKLFGHSHLHQDTPKLIVRRLNVFEVRLADGPANDRCDFGVGEIAWAQQ